MTCIVGLEHGGRVYIGGDSAGVSGYDVTVRSDEKVFENGNFIMGFTDSFRMGQILRYSFEPPDHDPRISEMKYLVTSFMDEIRNEYRDKGFMQKENEAESGGVFLLGYNGSLYYIDSDFQVGKSADGYMAIGCGDSYALGSMHSTQNLKDPEKRIRLALEAAAHHNSGVRAPFMIVSK